MPVGCSLLGLTEMLQKVHKTSNWAKGCLDHPQRGLLWDNELRLASLLLLGCHIWLEYC